MNINIPMDESLYAHSNHIDAVIAHEWRVKLLYSGNCPVTDCPWHPIEKPFIRHCYSMTCVEDAEIWYCSKCAGLFGYDYGPNKMPACTACGNSHIKDVQQATDPSDQAQAE